MLRRLGSRHPLIFKVTDLKILLVNNALTVNLEEKEICVALLEEFLLTEANTDIAATAPKLTNGESLFGPYLHNRRSLDELGAVQ